MGNQSKEAKKTTPVRSRECDCVESCRNGTHSGVGELESWGYRECWSGSSGTAEVLVNVAIIEHNEQLVQPPVVVADIRGSGSRSSSPTTMPSKQANDVLAVEELVHEIRENLRLKAKPAHQPTRSSRPSPYHIPCRSWSEPAVCGGQGEKRSLHKSCKKQEEEAIEDPYEFLQTLLKNNNLVKEAVRRLQHGLSPKQRYFYESDGEESRSPIVVMCQLES